MAKIDKKVLGEFRGRLGDVIGKIREGKHYVSMAPAKYRMSQEPHEVNKRNRFKVNGKLASIIKENEILFRVWDKEKIPANNAFNKISKLNFKLCNPERPSPENIITPGGFVLPVADVQSFPDRIEVELEMFDLLEEEKKITPVMIISFYEPLQKDNFYFQLAEISNIEQQGLKLIFRFNSTEAMYAADYLKRTLFLAVITEDENGKILRFSRTFGMDLE